MRAGAAQPDRDRRGAFWLCAGAQRAETSADDAYEHFIALHTAGGLLPEDHDRLRDALERNAHIIDPGAPGEPVGTRRCARAAAAATLPSV